MIGADAALGLVAAVLVAIVGMLALIAIEERERDPYYRARRRARIAAKRRAHLAQEAGR